MVYATRPGDWGSDFSTTDILATLFFGVLSYDPQIPNWQARDRFVMSKGRATGVLYTALCAAGFFPEAWLETYRGPDSKLNGHPDRTGLPGVEANTGPLGHGFSIAVGIAIAARLSGADYRTFVLTGDGEQQEEGSNWEAAMTAGHRKLSNLTLIIDRNRHQQGGRTEETSALDPLNDKYRAFGWEVTELDGHDHTALFETLSARSCSDKPRCVIAKTNKGRGVSFLEDKTKWHH